MTLGLVWPIGQSEGDQQAPVFTGRTDVVPVYVAVSDKNGRPVYGLTEPDFIVSVDGRAVPIGTFTAAPHPIAIAIALDLNFNMTFGQGFPRAFEAARALVNALDPADEVAIGQVNAQTASLASNKQGALDALRGGGWHPQSGSVRGIDWAIAALEPADGRRICVLMTDGAGYRWPSAAGGDFARRASAADIALHAITFEDSFIDHGFLTAVTDTGGASAFLLRDADLPRTFHDLVDELHHEYLLGFQPTAHDGRVHRVTVKVNRKDVTVRARRSYLAPSELK